MSDVSKYSVVDPRIVQQKPTYAVEKGALSLTNSKQNAIANSSSAQSYNIQVPSENVFVDRAVDWTSTVNLVVSFKAGADITAGDVVWQQGVDWALAPFPLHQLVSTMTATINDTTVTMNTSDVLPQVLRLVDLKDARRQRTCPTMLDRYVTYPDTLSNPNSPLSGYYAAFNSDEVPNGAWGQIKYFKDGAFSTALKDGQDTTDGIFTGKGGDDDGYGVVLTAKADIPKDDVVKIYLQFQSTEKLVLSPFIFGDEYELSTGLFGVQNIQLLMNIQPPTRVLRATLGSLTDLYTELSVSYGSTPFPQAVVDVQFLTPSLDVPLPAKSVVPYMEFPRYITTSTTTIPARSTGQVSSNTITLPNIPDFLYIFAKPQSYASASQGDWVLPFRQISVNFDNFSGLLASHTEAELYKMSVQNGLDMDWSEWRGTATSTQFTGTATADALALTCGGGLLLRPSRDIVLQAGQAPSLVGNFTFQFNATVFNQSESAVTPYIYVVAISSGFFETIKGSSRIIKGVLTEQDILSAPSVAPVVSDSSLQRLVGAGAGEGDALRRGKPAGPKRGMHAMKQYM